MSSLEDRLRSSEVERVSLDRELQALKREKEEAVNKVSQIINTLMNERADALAENEDLKSQLLTLSEEADESAQTSDSMAQSVWRGRYEALMEANESLKDHNATLQQAVKDSRTSPIASPVASPPPSTTSATPDLKLSKLRKQISTLTRQNRQLEREKTSLSTRAIDAEEQQRKRRRTDDTPAPPDFSEKSALEETAKLWVSWRRDIVTSMGDSKHINPTSTAATDDSMPPEVSAIVRAMDEQKRQILDTEMKIGQVKNENEECKRKISDLEVRASGAERSEATRCNNLILTC
ncbi:hypothetical protein TL16_g06418 [Triparma laevis f. inornata]|uniref:Uncharacterized protein n=1 Tax=Triparma laevis f. inornata TaxID=1714386 RepID=A0A9W7AJX2_9STRA|nr:hypothetical protein TL16_g06418 [Triparma laevis f. inornata]